MVKKVIPLLNKSLIEQWITIDLIKMNIKEVDISLIVALYDKAPDFVQEAVLETILQQAAIIGDLSLFEDMIDNKIVFNYLRAGDCQLRFSAAILQRFACDTKSATDRIASGATIDIKNIG